MFWNIQKIDKEGNIVSGEQKTGKIIKINVNKYRRIKHEQKP